MTRSQSRKMDTKDFENKPNWPKIAQSGRTKSKLVQVKHSGDPKYRPSSVFEWSFLEKPGHLKTRQFQIQTKIVLISDPCNFSLKTIQIQTFCKVFK
jgi:hypothetical protein